MMIDCDSCAVRGPACGGCVVTVLLGTERPGTGPVALPDPGWPEGPIEWDLAETRALAVLAGSGLVPPLRLVENNDPDRPRMTERPGSGVAGRGAIGRRRTGSRAG